MVEKMSRFCRRLGIGNSIFLLRRFGFRRVGFKVFVRLVVIIICRYKNIVLIVRLFFNIGMYL